MRWRRRRTHRQRLLRRILVGARLHAVESAAEGFQARLHADAAAFHRGLELRAAEGQHARARQRAEQHGADHAARLLRRLRHVEADEAPGRLLRMLDQLRAVDAAVAHRRLLGNRIDAVRRCDERRAVLRHQPSLHRAAGFHQLGGQHDVDVARQRHQRQHRLAAIGLRTCCRVELDVVDGGAGALRHAGHRGGLGDVAVVLAEVDDPVGQHAAAFAAHGEDRDLDGLCGVHAVQKARRSRRFASPRCIQPMTEERTRSRKRSQAPGLLTICAL